MKDHEEAVAELKRFGYSIVDYSDLQPFYLVFDSVWLKAKFLHGPSCYNKTTCCFL